MASSRSSILGVLDRLGDAKGKIEALDELVDNLTHDQIRFLQAKISIVESSSQDDKQALVTPFKALNSNAIRRRALEGLVRTLTHQQIRELRSATEEVDLHCDFVAKLPLEISQTILHHLPLYQVFQARRVSTKWHRILSSAQTIESLLRDWYPKCDGDQDLQIPVGLSAESVASLNAEHIDAYRTGHAFSYMRHDWNYFPYHIDPASVAYADGMMAWVREERSIEVLDLVTGRDWSFLPESRIRLQCIDISSSMVAVLGSGKCHIWTLRTDEYHSLQLPSASTQTLRIKGKSLAILHRAQYHEASSPAEFVTWTLKSQKTSSVSIALSPYECGVKTGLTFMLDSQGQSLVLFERVQRKGSTQEERAVYIYFKRISLDGVILAQGDIETPDTRDYGFPPLNGISKEANGRAVIDSFAKRNYPESASEIWLICYNLRKDQLEVRRHVVKGLCMDWTRTSYIFSWKDTAYFLENDYGHPRLRLVDLQNLTYSKAKMDFCVNFMVSDRRMAEGHGPGMYLVGDESFLVACFNTGFCVWCFDANVQIANEDITYKERRKENMKTRLLLKREAEKSNSEGSCARE